MNNKNPEASHSWDYLESIGVRAMRPTTSPFDPGYDPATLESHLEQSSHLISTLKMSMACWQIANVASTEKKMAAARRIGVPTCTGGGPFEVAATFGKIPEFLDLCAGLGFTRIEAGEGFTETDLDPGTVVRQANERKLEVQFEVGEKHSGSFDASTVEELIDQGRRWLDVGAKQIVVEARESAENVGLFGGAGEFDAGAADRFAEAFGLDVAVFEAPTKASQFALLNHFGPEVNLSNVRIEELLRVEIYRRGLHSDAFVQQNLRPAGPA